MAIKTKHYAMKLLITGLCIYAAYLTLLFFLQRGMMYPGIGQSIEIAEDAVNAYNGESAWLDTMAGRTEVWFLPPYQVSVPYPVIIYAHGNGEWIYDPPPVYEALRDQGVGILLVEYPGYGRSEGRPSQQTITAVMQAAYDWLMTRDDIDPGKIIGHGRSLGGGAICALARTHELAAMVLESTFTTTIGFARKYYAPSFLIRDSWQNIDVVRQYKKPILIFHGYRDALINYSHAEALHAAADHSQLVGDDCGHNDCPTDPQQYLDHWLSFLQEHKLLPQTALTSPAP